MRKTVLSYLNRFTPLIIILLVAVVLSFFIRDFVREVLVKPLLKTFWYASLIADSIPDIAFWLIFVGLCSFIALRSLRRREEATRHFKQSARISTGPVTQWARQLHYATTSDYAQWQLAQSLSRLSWNLLQEQHSQSLLDIEKGIKTKDLGLPADIQAYLEAGLGHHRPEESRQQRLSLGWLSKFKRQTTAHSKGALALDPERLITYLEHRLDPSQPQANLSTDAQPLQAKTNQETLQVE